MTPLLRKLTWCIAACSFAACTQKQPINYLDQPAPGKEARLFAPGVVSTEMIEHSSPAFAPDGSVVLWTVVDNSYHGYLQEMTFADGKWSAPHRASFADSTADDYYPVFAPDGSKLYFSSRRKLPEGYPDVGDMRIWVVDRTEGTWGAPRPMDTLVSRGHEYAHSVSGNGNLYFASSQSQSTSWNIQRSELSGNKYTEPVTMPYSINSVNYEEGPCISPSEDFLIFESQRPDGMGNSIDLYISFAREGGEWSIPINMGPTVNSNETERFARLSPDGKYLFFGSTRNQAPGRRGFDVYWIDAGIIDELRASADPKRSIDTWLGDRLLQALDNNDTDATEDLMKKWLPNDPSSIDANVIYLSVLRKKKAFAEAEALLETLPAPMKANAAVIMEQAVVKYATNKDTEAAELLKDVVTSGANPRENYLALASSLLEAGRFDVSTTYFEQAMTIHASSYPYFNRAQALALAGRKDDAFSALNRAVDLGGVTAREQYESAANLASLHSDARWTLLLKRLK